VRGNYSFLFYPIDRSDTMRVHNFKMDQIFRGVDICTCLSRFSDEWRYGHMLSQCFNKEKGYLQRRIAAAKTARGDNRTDCIKSWQDLAPTHHHRHKNANKSTSLHRHPTFSSGLKLRGGPRGTGNPQHTPKRNSSQAFSSSKAPPKTTGARALESATAIVGNNSRGLMLANSQPH